MTNNSFTTRLDGDVDIYNYKHLCDFINRDYDKKENYDVTGVAVIDWDFYTEMRSYGIKDIGAYATRVVVEMEVNVWGDDDDEVVAKIHIDTSKDDWEIETDMDDCDRTHYYPADYVVNFENKTIYVNF